MRFTFLLLMSGFLLGCEPAPRKPQPNTTVQPEQTQATTEEVNVTLEIKSYEELMTLIAEQKGKVVVMDCWATHCAPCVREFHHLVELHNSNDSEKLTCISLSFDFEGLGKKKPEDHIEKVLEVLKKKKANMINILSSSDSDTLYEKLDFGAIPTVFVFGPNGKIIEKVSPQREEDNMYERVNELIKPFLVKDSE